MNVTTAILTGLSLGLSAGGYCFWSCSAVMAPFLVATEEGPLRTRWSSVPATLKLLLWYHLGRLMAYLAVGLGVSLLPRLAPLPASLRAAALLATALLLGLAQLHPSAPGRCWQRPGLRRGGVVTLGLLQGLSPCPPFLMAVGLALSAQRPLAGVLLFVFLFFGTALYTLPLALVESLRRRRWLLWATRAIGWLVCALLIWQAARLIIGGGS